MYLIAWDGKADQWLVITKREGYWAVMTRHHTRAGAECYIAKLDSPALGAIQGRAIIRTVSEEVEGDES